MKNLTDKEILDHLLKVWSARFEHGNPPLQLAEADLTRAGLSKSIREARAEQAKAAK